MCSKLYLIPDLCRCQYELLSFFRNVIWTWDFIKIYFSRIFIEIRYSGNFDHIFLQQKCHRIYNKNHRNYEKVLFWGKYISFANTPVNWNLSKIYFIFVEAYEFQNVLLQYLSLDQEILESSKYFSHWSEQSEELSLIQILKLKSPWIIFWDIGVG